MGANKGVGSDRWVVTRRFWYVQLIWKDGLKGKEAGGI
jgi:hypothetical protein